MKSSVLKIIIVLVLFNIIFPLRALAVTFNNPLCDPTDPTCNPSFTDIINKIINFIFWVGVVIFPIMAIIAGFLFLSSGGDPSKVKKAKDLLLYSIIGLFIVLLAKGIISVIKSLLGVS
jgi:magnesium-transporting ATPase (P-type)